MTAQRWLSVCPWPSCVWSLWTADEEGDLKISVYSWVSLSKHGNKSFSLINSISSFFFIEASPETAAVGLEATLVVMVTIINTWSVPVMPTATHKNTWSSLGKTLEIWVTISTPPTLHNLYHSNDNTELSMIIGTTSNFTWEIKNTLLFYILIFMFVDLCIQPNVKALYSLLLSYFLQPLDVVEQQNVILGFGWFFNRTVSTLGQEFDHDLEYFNF